MTRIRINTEYLKTKAEDFESAADAFARAGDEIAAVAEAMPSYDGQLSGPARKAGYEIQSQAREMKAALAGDAESLRKTAQAFEEADNQAIEAFAQSQESLLFGIDDTWSEGSAYLGYNDDPSTKTLIICMYCVCRKISETPENEEIRIAFKKAVDDYNSAREDMWPAFYVYSAAYATWAALVEVTILTGGLIAWATIGKIAAAYAAMMAAYEIYEGYCKAMKDASARAAAAWNLLPGASAVKGAEHVGPFASRPCSDQKVFEP